LRRNARRTERRSDRPSSPVRSKRFPAIDRFHLLVWGVFLLCTALAFGQLLSAQFINFDDPEYVTSNTVVQSGLSLTGLIWAFSTHHSANWIPLTWLSHMLDWQLFGGQSGYHHLVSVWVHLMSSLLLFELLASATGARWRSAAVAFLFAFHPVHVESVAWIAERKDVLCAFFWLLTLWLYARYARNPFIRSYSLTLVAFLLGLLSKQMIVTLPFTLFLFDLWPLGRLKSRAQLRGIILEKLPFVALAAAASWVTYWSQAADGKVNSQPVGLRLANAATAYLIYLYNLIWPARLAVFYPFPARIPVWEWSAAAITLLVLSAVAIFAFGRYSYLTIGWLWFVVTLLPVIGVVQVGSQARADRYLYIPSIGLFIALVWVCGDAAQRWPVAKRVVPSLAAVVFAVCLTLTWRQTRYWQASEPLMRRAIEVTNGNYLAYNNLGNALLYSSAGDVPVAAPDVAGAVRDYRIAIGVNPSYAEARYNLALALLYSPSGAAEAIPELETALRLQPSYPEAHNALGMALARLPGRTPDAIREFEAAIRQRPRYAEAHGNLANALLRTPGRLDDAISEDRTVLSDLPQFAQAHYNLASALLEAGKPDEAVDEYRAAVRIDPDLAEAHYNLGVVLSRMSGRENESESEFNAAFRLRPDLRDLAR
jgi:protein O-mannosyl-transferase